MCSAAARWRSSTTRAEFDDYLLGVLPSLVPADVKARYPNDKTGQINTVLGKNPLLFDRYLSDAIEIDVDALCDGKTVFVAGDHGAYRGGRHPFRRQRLLACRPLAEPRDRSPSSRSETAKLALALEVGGLMNVQYALKDGESTCSRSIPRASRTVPFVAKVIGQPIAKIASRVMAGESLASFGLTKRPLNHVGVKEAVFPVRPLPRRRHGAGPGDALDRRGHGPGPAISPSPSPRASSARAPSVPLGGAVFVSLRDADKPRIVEPLKALAALGFKIIATGGTQRFLAAHGVAAVKINKVSEGRPHAADAVRNGGVQLMFNTTEGATSLADSKPLRRAALLQKTPYYTTLAGAIAAVEGVKAYASGDLEVRALQDYFA